MRRVAAFLTLSAVLVFTTTSGAEAVGDNPRVAELLEQDQADRKGFPNTTLSWAEINVRDEARREEILSMLTKGELRTAQDFYFSAVIFHHGEGRYPIDESAVTDEERARFQVKPLAEIRQLKNGSVRVEP